ncbi:T9SS type A sorting domain-containing protein, partial [Mangrovibacterium lignilyticum]|uniref:T9SS type A sorting domain-containing protein n=1 Tax=Mangrovibacterium lignilyticum TaxID=2668052 RepID=UPI0013D81022
APVISCPADMIVDCEFDGESGMATATDNCTAEGDIVIGYVDSSDLDDCGLGMITRTWTATDCAGNSSSCEQMITVKDDEAPVLNVPADVRFECEMGDAGMATATDNCTAEGDIEISYNDDVVLEHCGVVTRTWTAIDCAGNMTTGVQMITVYDETPPTIMGEDYAVCNEELPYEITVAWTDNCSEGGELTAVGEFYSATECDTVYAYMFSVTDDCDNLTEKTIYVTKESDKYGYCETAIAKLDGDYESDARCFLEDGFSRWGWTNMIVEEGEYTMPLYAGAAQCMIDKGALVGQVVVTYSGGTVTVEYQIDEGYAMSEAHIYVGCEPYPTINGTPTVAPGQFTFNAGYLDHVNGLTAEFDNVQGGFYIIAHAVTCEMICSCSESEGPIYADGYEPMDLSIDCNLQPEESIEVESPEPNDVDLVASPNPFDDQVTFSFTANRDGLAKIDLYNMFGQKVASILRQQVTAGEFVQVQYIPDGIVTGTYIYQFKLGATVVSGKLNYTDYK